MGGYSRSDHFRMSLFSTGRSRYFVMILWLGLLVLGRAAQPVGQPPPDFRQVSPLAGVQAAALEGKIALEGLALPTDRMTLLAGDQVTILATLTENKVMQQWLISLVAVQPTSKEMKVENKARFYSETGHELRFGSANAALEVTVIGPFKDTDESKNVSSKHRRLTVNADYLSLGLERVPAFILRMKAFKAANPTLSGGGSMGASNRPPSAIDAEAAKKNAAIYGIEEADERAVAGSALALLEFFNISANTPGLQDVLLSVIDVPWWSFIKSGGKLKGINFQGLDFSRALDPLAWQLPAPTNVYASPVLIHINGQPTLLCQFAVTAPKSPLTVSAGIVGLAAGRPDGKGPVLTMQVIASRAAASP